MNNKLLEDVMLFRVLDARTFNVPWEDIAKTFTKNYGRVFTIEEIKMIYDAALIHKKELSTSINIV